jgi:hypothetical protein
VAEDAWEHLVSALSAASDTARSVGGNVKDRASEFAGEASSRYSSASDRVGSAADEAWNRAGLALDALTGRKSRKPWGWIAVAVLGGIAVGWAVAASAPKAIQAATNLLTPNNPNNPDDLDDLPSSNDPPTPDQSAPATP